MFTHKRLAARLLAVTGLALASSAAHAGITIVASATPFTNIAATGTSVVPPGALCDDCEYIITAAALTAAGFTGNELLAGGVSINVGNNGGVVWNPVINANGTTGTGDQIGYINSNTLPTMVAGNTTINGNGNGARQFVCPLWDDNFPGAGANVRWQVIAGNLYIQWTNEDHFNAQGTGTVTYQMIVYSGASIDAGHKLVEFVYDDTLYASPAYQNDGGSATIGYKNWGVHGNANDVEFGLGGGVNTLADPTYAVATNMQPKVGGWTASFDAALPHSVAIMGVPVGPSCDGDVNCDFALDGFDVEVQEKAVGGDLTDYCQADPDFNGDFALDGFDVEAVEIVVGGGPCP